jgi:hypothetical protein
LQEKPFASTVKDAQEALLQYRQLVSPPVWGLAENYRSKYILRDRTLEVSYTLVCLFLRVIFIFNINPGGKHTSPFED